MSLGGRLRDMRQLSAIDNFEQLVDETDADYVLAIFTASWCGPCKAMAPVLEQLDSLHSHVEFVKIDVEQVPGLAQFQNVQSVPTYKIFAKGNGAQALTYTRGAQNKTNFERWLLDSTPVDVDSAPRDQVVGVKAIESESNVMGE